MIEELVIEAQQIIMANNPRGYYCVGYKDAELNYWKDMLPWIYDHIHEKLNAQCLDIGAAYGTLSIFCKVVNPSIILTIVDFVKYTSDELINKYNIKFILKNIETDEIEFDKKFDIIILTEVFEHFNFNPIETLKKISNLLSENGRLYLSTPNSSVCGKLPEYTSYKEMPLPTKSITVRDQHIYQYSYDELLEIFKNSNLTTEKFSCIDGEHFNIELKRKAT